MTWRQHRLATTDRTALRRIAENLLPMSTLARAADAEVGETIDLPDLPELH